LLIDKVDSIAGGVTLDARGFGAFVDDSTAPVTVLGGGVSFSKQIILAAEGGLDFRAGRGNVTVVAGGGNNKIFFEKNDKGVNEAFTSSGNDTIFGGEGHTTISAGGGDNMIYTRGGDTKVITSGSDNIKLGEGAVTVSVLAGGSAYVHGAGPVTVGGYSLTFVGDTKPGALSNTVYGGLGRVSIDGGAGGGLFRGGTEGGNYIYGGSGTVTIEGAGAGDTLKGGTGSNDYIRASIGNETLIGGAGKTTFGVYDEHPGQIAGSIDKIYGFTSSDVITLIGAGLEPAAYSEALATYHVMNGNTSFKLLDGTTVLIVGYTGPLNHSDLK
jgi:Ca2+-binding RTX toxin-like protein